MIRLKDKSEFNLHAADVLISQGLHAPSVHCSYFASFQQMSYLLCKKEKKVPDDYDNEKRQNSIDQTLGSHEYLLKRTISHVSHRKDIQSIRRLFKDLKAFRKKSDYSLLAIDSAISDEALTKSKTLIRELKAHLV